MEVLYHFSGEQQKAKWLTPLAEGRNTLGIRHDRTDVASSMPPICTASGMQKATK
jgi:hypothetical protein